MDGDLSYTPKQGFLKGSLDGLISKRCFTFSGTVVKQVAPVSLFDPELRLFCVDFLPMSALVLQVFQNHRLVYY